MARIKRPQHADDIVIYNDGPGVYVIANMGGQRIATSDNRLDAMRRACAAAGDGGATVWVCIDASSDIYNEVLCP
jgi:hypothetical protein